MKNIILIMLSTGLFLTFLISCNKQNDNIEINKTTEMRVSPNSDLPKWHDNGNIPGIPNVDYGCWGTGGNCLPTVVVVGYLNQNAVTRACSKIQTNDIPGLKSALQEDYDILSNIFGSNNIQSIINGEATLSLRGSFSQNSVAYFLIYENNDLIQVVPVTQ